MWRGFVAGFASRAARRPALAAVPRLALAAPRPLLLAPPPLPAAARACSSLVETLAPAPAAPAPSAALAVGATRFAVMEMSGSQHKVAVDDIVCVEKLDLAVGATVSAKRVLLVGERGATIIGSPLVEGASVLVQVEEQGYGDKVIVFKKKRRKGYRRWRGYRSRLTVLRVLAIDLPEGLEAQLAQPPEPRPYYLGEINPKSLL